MGKIVIKVELDEEELYFLDVPTIYKNFVIKNYGYAGFWLMETDSKELNHWKVSLPTSQIFKGYRILGFVNDVFSDEIPSDKNFVLQRIK